MNAMSLSPENVEAFLLIYKTVASVFKYVAPYHVYMPLDGDICAFWIASNHKYDFECAIHNQSFSKKIATKYYSANEHSHMFHIPKHLSLESMHKERVLTDMNPLFI
jgi:spermidine synthase